MTPTVPGVVELREVGRDDIGRFFEGRSGADHTLVRLRLVDRRLDHAEYARLAGLVRQLPVHRRLIAVRDVGLLPDGVAYVVSAAGIGEPLAGRLARGSLLSADEACAVISDVCEALAVVHATGLVHGGVTPASVVAGPDGYVLADVGLLAIVAPLPGPADARVDEILAFTAPEVLLGGPCSPASDLFSLAATVSQLVTGSPPVAWSQGEQPSALAERWNKPDLAGLPDGMRPFLASALDPRPDRRPARAEELALLAVSASGQRSASPPEPVAVPPLQPAPGSSETGSPHGHVIDDDVQFTVYRPEVVLPDRWHSLLVFAHRTEPFVDEELGPLDPLDEVRRQAAHHLGDDIDRYVPLAEDSSQAVAWGSELRVVPHIEGVVFNPPSRSFLWVEPVHQEEFRFRVPAGLGVDRVRGALSVYFGTLLIAEVGLSIRIGAGGPEPVIAERGRPYRKIFASYSHRDLAVVRQVETFVSTVGDRFLRDATDLRSGEVWSDGLAEMIRDADVFQLFWSSNSMASPFVSQEWTYALGLGRPNFIRPVYWEDPMPARPEDDLPPSALARLHFSHLLLPGPPVASPPSPAGVSAPAAVSAADPRREPVAPPSAAPAPASRTPAAPAARPTELGSPSAGAPRRSLRRRLVPAGMAAAAGVAALAVGALSLIGGTTSAPNRVAAPTPALPAAAAPAPPKSLLTHVPVELRDRCQASGGARRRAGNQDSSAPSATWSASTITSSRTWPR